MIKVVAWPNVSWINICQIVSEKLLGVGIPVGIYFALGARSEKLLAGLNRWMGRHNAAIMTVLCLLIAAKLIGDAISELAG